ncbi:hypothetical protein niasHT_036763 [Heterodera trifolii]|uniref:Uncharacterized protein n=1 Tax=Heterodera trifolii TaxID=157864 RepID=A0ABD2J1H8_9BILA
MATGGKMGFGEIVPKLSQVTEWDTMANQSLADGLRCEIKQTWDGKPLDGHGPIKIWMRWHFRRMFGQPHKRVIRVEIEAPLVDDPEPPSEFAGICTDLYNYECVELFFANDKGFYTEVEVGPHGHWLVLLHKGYRQCFNSGDNLQLEVKNEWKGTEWHCQLEIPLAYLPGNVTKFNAYALHGSDEQRHFEALHAVTDGTLTEPDFHNLMFFGKLDTKRIIPDGYNRTVFNDLKYGDLWEEATSDK